MTTLPEIDDDLRARMRETYEYLHAHPELSMAEHETAAFIETRLAELGVEEVFRCGGTGVVGVIRNGDGPTVAFRADHDGLPIEEDTGLPYASTATGTLPDGREVPVMHGCGHDTHVTAALAMAELLLGAREAWSGTLVLVFQPGEETAAGARAMVADGLWDTAPRPAVVFGQHVMPGLSGTVALSVGDAMAMADSLKVTVRGRQSHGSQPEDAIDPIVLASHIVVRLQTIVAREVAPLDSAVVTVGTFHAGLKENIIPATAVLDLNVRTHEPDVRAKVLASIRRIVEAEALASGAPEPVVEEIYGFPRTYNDPEAAEALIEVFGGVLGKENVVVRPPLMGSEDFGLLAEAIDVPAVFWFFGGHPREVLEGEAPVPKNHSPFFAPVVEPTLGTGTRAAVAAVLSRLGR